MILNMIDLVGIADLHNAVVMYDGLDKATIGYNELGEGTAISEKIQEAYPAVRIKMIPSERLLEVELLTE